MKIAITGSSRGIGYAISEQFKAQGHDVIGFNKSEGWDISNKNIINLNIIQIKTDRI